MMRQIFSRRFFAQVNQVEVRFVVLADGTGLHGAEVTIDGVKKLTDKGLASFYNIEQGDHSYSIVVPPGLSLVTSGDPFNRPLTESGTTTIEWAPVPDVPWPSEHPWLMYFEYVSTPDGNEVPDENGEIPENGVPISYGVIISVQGSGTTEPASGTYSIEEDSLLEVSAYPDEGWEFAYWIMNELSYTENPIQKIVLEAIDLQAVFNEVGTPPPSPPPPGLTPLFPRMRIRLEPYIPNLFKWIDDFRTRRG